MVAAVVRGSARCRSCASCVTPQDIESRRQQKIRAGTAVVLDDVKKGNISTAISVRAAAQAASSRAVLSSARYSPCPLPSSIFTRGFRGSNCCRLGMESLRGRRLLLLAACIGSSFTTCWWAPVLCPPLPCAANQRFSNGGELSARHLPQTAAHVLRHGPGAGNSGQNRHRVAVRIRSARAGHPQPLRESVALSAHPSRCLCVSALLCCRWCAPLCKNPCAVSSYVAVRIRQGCVTSTS